MFEAIENNDLDFIRNYNGDIHVKDDDGWTPLHHACYDKCYEAIELLIIKGADVNAKNNDGWTPLHEACIWNCYEIVELLISKGSDVNAKNNDGYTPLDYAKTQKMKDLLAKALDKLNKL